jgi:hypothetical protein
VVSKWYWLKPVHLGTLNVLNWQQVLSWWLKASGYQYTMYGGVRKTLQSVSPWTYVWQWYSTWNVCVSASVPGLVLWRVCYKVEINILIRKFGYLLFRCCERKGTMLNIYTFSNITLSVQSILKLSNQLISTLQILNYGNWRFVFLFAFFLKAYAASILFAGILINRFVILCKCWNDIWPHFHSSLKSIAVHLLQQPSLVEYNDRMSR